MVFTCTIGNFDLHIPVYMIGISILVSDYCILFAQLPVMLILYDTNCSYFLNLRKMRPLWLVAGLALINPNMAFYVYLDKQKM